MDITLTDDEYNFCEHLANLRTRLQKSGNDPSLRYTTPALDRGANNIIGQVAEYAVLKYLYRENIPFSALCFAITYVSGSTGVLPPLADFILVDGKSFGRLFRHSNFIPYLHALLSPLNLTFDSNSGINKLRASVSGIGAKRV